jgi:serine/threonine-protein kinase
MLARALVFQERHDEAAALLLQALRIKERVYGPVHPSVASTVNELGNIAMGRGELDKAEAHFSRMASIYRSVYGEKHYLLGIAQSNLASVYMTAGQIRPCKVHVRGRDRALW